MYSVFFLSQKLKYQHKKYIKKCDWHLKIHLRSCHVLAGKNKPTDVVVEKVSSGDDDCVDGAKDLWTSRTSGATPTSSTTPGGGEGSYPPPVRGGPC